MLIPPQGEISRLTRRLAWPAAAAAGAVALFVCALREAASQGVDSDAASFVLQAHAMLHGNLLLHGWYLSDVSYYTTELPEYMAVELVRGTVPGVMQACAALTYTLLVLLAAFAARGGDAGRTGVVRAAIAVAVMLGPSIAAASVLLTNPDHAGTAVPVLALFALIDQAGRRRWVPAAAGLGLAVALVGDPLVLLIGVLPVVFVYGTRACQALLRGREPLAAAWYEVSLTAAALGSVAAAAAITHVIRALGGYITNPGAQKFVRERAMPANAWGTFQNFLRLFSGDFFGERFGHGLAFTAIHLAAAALVAVALAAALKRLFRGGDPLASLLAVAICGDLLAYSFIFDVNGATLREISPVFALGAALAGRVLAGPLLRNRLEPLLAVGMACSVWASTPPVLLPAPAKAHTPALASWLQRHHLSQGIAGFWQANSITLDSGGRVTIRAVRGYPEPGLNPYPWELDVALDNSRAYDVNFLVATAPRSQGGSTVTEPMAVARFGKPCRVYRYEQYTILVWRKNLLHALDRRQAVAARQIIPTRL